MGTADHDLKLDSLLASAARVFAERGFHDTSMRDLAAATGLSLSSLYYYVRSKEELLYLIQLRSVEGVAGAVRAIVRPSDGPLERLAQFIEVHLRFSMAHRAQMKVLAHETSALSGAFLAAVVARRREYAGLLDDILAGIEQASGPAFVDRRLAARALFGMMDAIYAWDGADGEQDVARLARQLFTLFVRGFAPVGASALPRSARRLGDGPAPPAATS